MNLTSTPEQEYVNDWRAEELARLLKRLIDIPPDTTDNVVFPKSVRDLVRSQLRLDDDPWELALVQWDLVWKQDRMVGLLDSLLAG